jgi:hypothetical protein
VDVEAFWDGIRRIGAEDGNVTTIAPRAIAQLIEFGLVEINSTGLPQFTDSGKIAYATVSKRLAGFA